LDPKRCDAIASLGVSALPNTTFAADEEIVKRLALRRCCKRTTASKTAQVLHKQGH
jgi:hypothetical protein